MADLSQFTTWIRQASEAYDAAAEELTELDRLIGDADHGSNMRRGFAAVAQVASAEQFVGIEPFLKKVGMTLVSTVGGASGPLYGTFFLRLAGPLAGYEQVGAPEFGAALRAGVEGVVARGRAEADDKTMYDAWAPALTAFDEAAGSGADLHTALTAAAQAAAAGRDATEHLAARKGRASYLGERSRGHVDPGAASTVILLESAAQTLS